MVAAQAFSPSNNFVRRAIGAAAPPPRRPQRGRPCSYRAPHLLTSCSRTILKGVRAGAAPRGAGALPRWSVVVGRRYELIYGESHFLGTRL
eukprot:6129288-Prymnesium_polylepis.1